MDISSTPPISGRSDKQRQFASDCRVRILSDLERLIAKLEEKHSSIMSETSAARLIALKTLDVRSWVPGWSSEPKSPTSCSSKTQDQEKGQDQDPHFVQDQDTSQNDQEPTYNESGDSETPRSWLGLLPAKQRLETLLAIKEASDSLTAPDCAAGLGNLQCEFRAGHQGNHRATSLGDDNKEFCHYWNESGYYGCIEVSSPFVSID
jgi:hypothetical protein